MSPTQRTLAECKKRGWTAGIVERRLTRFVTQDFLGCIDIIAVTPDGLVGIQATSGANHAARVTKARQEPRLSAWLSPGRTFEVWSWSKRGARGERKRWQLRAESVSRETFHDGTVAT